MTDALRIPLTRDRAIWLFAIDLPDAEIDALLDADLAPLLGIDAVDAGQIEVIDTDTLRVIGLAKYLTEANGMDDAMVAPDATMLDSLNGRLLMVFRAALGDGDTRLRPQAPLRFIGHYAEPAPALPRPMPESASAQGEIVVRGKPSDAAMSGRVATAVLVLLFIFTALFIWMAG